jgi:hypothetical protein
MLFRYLYETICSLSSFLGTDLREQMENNMKRITIILLFLALFTGCITVVLPANNQPGIAPSAANKPVINSFAASPAGIQAGSPSVISWNVSGATEIRIVPEIGPTDREITITVFPDATTEYTLTAINQAGSVSKTIRVEVAGPAPGLAPASLQSERMAILGLLGVESGSLSKNMTTYTWSSTACAGDNAANLASRAFLSFDISSIPPAARVTEAILDFSSYAVTGSPTYTSASWGNMGALDAYQYQYGPALSNGRLMYDASAPRVGSLKLTGIADSVLKLDVTNNANGENTIQQLIAVGQSRCQFRIQFFTSTNWDGKTDMICLDGAILKVKYSMP